MTSSYVVSTNMKNWHVKAVILFRAHNLHQLLTYMSHKSLKLQVIRIITSVL